MLSRYGQFLFLFCHSVFPWSNGLGSMVFQCWLMIEILTTLVTIHQQKARTFGLFHDLSKLMGDTFLYNNNNSVSKVHLAFHFGKTIDTQPQPNLIELFKQEMLLNIPIIVLYCVNRYCD